MSFEVVSPVEGIEVIARGVSLRDRARLVAVFGAGRWRKLKGVAVVVEPGDRPRRAEVHWYEAHGVGRREMKIKRYLE